MAIHNILTNTGEWLRGDGPHHKIVVSSRVRLARNLRGFAFPGWAKRAERISILETIKPRVEELPEMSEAFSVYSQDLTALEKQVLVERHLISREHAAKGVGSAVVTNRKQTLSIMINEEDHLRMQGIRAGLQLKNVFKLIDKADSGLEERLDYAFHPRLGYLTACPTNVGTGMRASAMVHLPALVLSEQINQIIAAVGKIGLAVRGLYGEGTEALGNLFQVSNQTTLGENEGEIIERLNKVILSIIEHERNARGLLLQKRPNTLFDHVGRGYGILRHAYAITSKEALSLLSYMKLGIDLGFFPEAWRQIVDELFMETQPAHLQKGSQTKLAADERDFVRARIMREKLADCPKPDLDKARESNGAEEDAG
jgi:protein arginine kinase